MRSFYLSIGAAGYAACSAAAFKWFPSYHNWAVVQNRGSAAIGIFHGLIAGPVWAGCITFGIVLYQVTFERNRANRSVFQPAGALVAGALSGAMSSLLIVSMMLGLYQPISFQEMGWLTEPYERFSPEFLRDIFLTTRFGWVHVITGTGVGLGIAATINSLRAGQQWSGYIRQQGEAPGDPRIMAISRRLLAIELRHFWQLPLFIVIAATCAFFVPVFVSQPRSASKANMIALIQGLIGDCGTQLVGAFFAIAGMGVATILMRRLRR